MHTSISFKVLKWDFNKKATLKNAKTECNLLLNPLRQESLKEAAGLGLKWILILTGDGLEILYYSTQEAVLIPDKSISDAELQGIHKSSFEKAANALIPLNVKVGLNAGFPQYSGIPFDAAEMRKVLGM